MKSIIYDLYFGRIAPWERRPPQTVEYKELTHKTMLEEQYSANMMSKDDFRRLESWMNLETQVSSITDIDAFTHGFKLGAMFMKEVFIDEYELPNSEYLSK